MPRAIRHYIPGHAWHITHRCHKKEFVLKFAKDRQRWIVLLRACRLASCRHLLCRSSRSML